MKIRDFICNGGIKMIAKTSDILYKMKARKIRLIDTKVSMAGPAGIRSICRGGKPAPAKFSTIGHDFSGSFY